MGLERFAGGANGRKGLLSAGELGLGGGGWQSFGNDMGGVQLYMLVRHGAQNLGCEPLGRGVEGGSPIAEA